MFPLILSFSFSLLILCCNCSTPTSRTVTFINQCDQDYYINTVSNAAPLSSPSISACGCDDDCIEGSSCLIEAEICYFDVPTPTTGSFSVLARGTNSITFPFYDNGEDLHWAGNFGFCGNNMSCTQTPAVCEKQGCGVYAGPYNIAEINFSKTELDYYDISNIGGINVPMSIGPDVTKNVSFIKSDPYRCGNPGSNRPLTGVGASSWSPIPPSVHYQWVIPSSKSCSQDSDCPRGEVCGFRNHPGKTPQFELTCGVLIGWWSADSVCGQDPDNLLNFGPFECFGPTLNGLIGTTIGSMQGCSGTSGSGYTKGADTEVCGCQDWYKLFGTDIVPLQTPNCSNSNPLWISQILPTLIWLKAACPSCYVYPYDDKSSTFTCELIWEGYNIQNYTITLCPAGPHVPPPPLHLSYISGEIILHSNYSWWLLLFFLFM